MTESAGLIVVQLNCQRGRSVMYELGQCLRSERVDAALLQEPYCVNGRVCGLPSDMRLFLFASEKAAVAVCKDTIACQVLQDCKGVNEVCVWIKCEWGEAFLASMYCPLGESMEASVNDLERMFVRVRGRRILVGMDANASSGLWFSKRLNTYCARENRGRVLEEWILASNWDLRVVNEPSAHYTFSGPNGESDIDVTLSTFADGDCESE